MSDNWWLVPEIIFQEATKLFKIDPFIRIEFDNKNNEWLIIKSNKIIYKEKNASV